ncbi:MAG: hypothetical protein K2L89_02345 [Muribaculaceae bacterium]|nr:hypothetical protein [Muribaculaceae bacterium]
MIKQILISLSLLFSLSSVSAQDQNVFPACLDGSMMPYDFSTVDSLPAIPDGYTPVHISYVARHGARYLSSPKKVEKIKKALTDACQNGNITVEGENFLFMIEDLCEYSKDRWGLLSDVGINEEKILGKDMARMFPDLLKKGKTESVSTFVPRVIMTMYEFTHALEESHQNLHIYTSSGHQNDSTLYFFDSFAKYRDFRNDGAWKKVYDDYVERNVSYQPARRLFKSVQEMDSKHLRNLTMEMFGVMQGNRASGFKADPDEWFSQKEYEACYKASNLVHYLRNTPNSLDPYCAPATATLIERIIADADKALSNNRYSSSTNFTSETQNISSVAKRNDSGTETIFSGYFGHAETLLPLLSVMNIPGCWYPFTKFDNIDSHWKLQEITPLGANLTIIFLRKTQPESPQAKAVSKDAKEKSKYVKEKSEKANTDILVSLRLNGRNISAYPGAPQFIKWSDLKEYWQMRIHSFSRPKANLR